ncbi:MAG: YbfB/YjiJ family MFS transporter [Clostridia bacterium]|nr:YbfB/YjiJ family MFS transporter [Clostridia bacterium]
MKLSAKRVEVHYAAVQGTYWASNCTLRGLMAVFLTFHGFNDAQIGYTSSLVYCFTISLSLLLSAWADKHPLTPLKRTVTALYLVGLAAAAVLYLLPLPVLLFMLVYALNCCFHNCADSILNALMMQYVDNGIPARYGWPRGVGSITYAIMAWVLGALMETYTPNVILPVFLGLCTLSLAALLVLPDPGPRRLREQRENKVSYGQMLKTNPTLVLLLVACILSGMGQCASTTFLIRVVEKLGGTSRELGIAMFIQAGVELPMMFASGWLLKRFSAGGLLTLSFFCNGVKLLLLCVAPSLPFLYAVMVFSMFCFGIFGFASVLFVNSIAGVQEKVRAQSLLSLCYTGGLGGILGNLLSGALIGVIGLNCLFLLSAGLCLAGAGVMVLCLRQYRKQFLQ